MSRPTIVCLCGSTRFKDAFIEANRRETLAGKIVLSVGMFGHDEGLDMSGPVKAALDRLHLAKIDLADEVLVLNPLAIVCGRCGKPTRLFTEASGETECCRDRNWERRSYVGDSTRREIQYAQGAGKPIRWLEPMDGETDGAPHP
jgi:hypothetical protein